jgi:hypothetical protein
MAPSTPACGKTPSAQIHRRTAVTASENVTASFPGHDTDPVRLASGSAWYRAATTEYNPNRHGAARQIVARDRPRVVSRPVHDRHS